MNATPPVVPAPRTPITIRVAGAGDFAFIDALQSAHSKRVGWMPRQQLEGKIRAGHVLVAESEAVGSEAVKQSEGNCVTASPLHRVTPVGYCIGQDQYFKRDDVGIIYQLNVAPGARRRLIGATLVKAMFERAAYGCRLFCCWCAQDIEANYFWESLGFIPLAFRAGSRRKDRVHIFWQRRIRPRDEASPGGTTPYWFPAQTSAGLIREDRLVLPIPPGKSWRDVMPRLLPTAGVPTAGVPAAGVLPGEAPALPAERTERTCQVSKGPKPQGVRLGPPPSGPQADAVTVTVGEKPKREKKGAGGAKVRNDPKLVAAARELRDRWLEHANAPGEAGALLGQGKYDVARSLPDARAAEVGRALPALPALPAPIAA